MSAITALAGQQAHVSTDWEVVAPWYRWRRKDGLEPERAEGDRRPALHKFDSTDFVTDFLDDPQRTLRFDPDLDVNQVITTPPNPTSGLFPARLKRLNDRVRTPGDVRKLFLAAHQRFYVVSVNLNCDRPGYPRVDPSAVHEVGFVIRRVRRPLDDDQRGAAAGLLADLAMAKVQAQSQASFEAAKARSRVLHPFRSPKRARVQPGPQTVDNAYQNVHVATNRLKAWAELNTSDALVEAWVPTGEGNFGAWVPASGQPEEVIETTYPMRLLSPPPSDPDHVAHDGTIYWSAVPTASDQVTPDGSGRFDENAKYFIQVYARSTGKCPGPIVWSEPSEHFRLASFYDGDGCAQRPIEIRLPDFAQLEASTATPSVKMTAPPGSSLAAQHDPPKEGEGEFEEICFFAIPLITIVALFVLNIFLPIILFIFNLWWMLKLKFCIPPSIEIEAKLDAALDVTPPEFAFVADFDVEVKPGNFGAIRDALAEMFNQGGKEYQGGDDPFKPDYDFGDDLVNQYSVDALMKLAVSQGYGRAAEGGAPDFTTDPAYTTPVRFDQVVHP